MEAITKRLPLLAFALAAFAAVAFTSPKELPTEMYGFDGTDWYLIEGQIGVDYRCDSHNQPQCLYDAVEGNPIQPQENGKFVNVTLDPVDDPIK